ncbi:VanZ family protein [Aureimonas sp. AU4]|uniref:VanZ family protein n=1 Tax=Aureimonas sp. AU4 TaxID=1638163 RepID=UPI0009E711A6|nr:VanZ family protein [Aureimonas sp. AU4]
MPTRHFSHAAWFFLAAIVFITIAPIGLRPEQILTDDLDRAIAFAVLAILFVIAYPRRWVAIGLVLILGAGGIELLQLITSTRHARIEDAVVKATGVALGVALGCLFNEVTSPPRCSRRTANASRS